MIFCVPASAFPALHGVLWDTCSHLTRTCWYQKDPGTQSCGQSWAISPTACAQHILPSNTAYTASMRRRLVCTAYFKVKMKLISRLTSKPKSLKTKQKPNKTFCCESITPSHSLCKSTGSCRSLTTSDPMSTETIIVHRLNHTLLFQPWKLLAWQSLLGSKHTCLINYKYGMNHRENSHLPMNMIQV